MKERLFEQFDKEFLSYCEGTSLELLELHSFITNLLDFLFFSGVINAKEYRFLCGASRAVCYGQ